MLSFFNCAQKRCDRRADLIYDLNWSVGFHLSISFRFFSPIYVHKCSIFDTRYHLCFRTATEKTFCTDKDVVCGTLRQLKIKKKPVKLQVRAQVFVGGAVEMDQTERAPRASVNELTGHGNTMPSHFLNLLKGFF